MTRPPHPAQGAAALPIVLVLSLALVLAVGFAHRNVVFEVRSAGNQVRAAQAHESAQAGLAWALARLNHDTPLDDNCQPTDAASSRSWPERARSTTLQASCIAHEGGWDCHCPATGPARAIAVAGEPAFAVTVSPDDATRWRVNVLGHSGQAGPVAALQQQLGWLPSPDSPPAAALTVRGHARFAGVGGSFLAEHTEATPGGPTVHAGGSVSGPALVPVGPPGTPAALSVLADDGALAALTPQGLQASLFRLDRAAWLAQPRVQRVDCESACDNALREAARDHRLIALEGGLRLDTPLMLGSPEQPLVLLVQGPVVLRANVQIHGLVYTTHPRWTDLGGSVLRGALVAEGDFEADGRTRLLHDRQLLQTLRRQAGTFAPLTGSWRDL
jgi:hypothetical protein